MSTERTFYCVKCRKKCIVPAQDICVKVYRNPKTGSTPALRGECGKCGTTCTKFIKRDSLSAMKKKYGSC